MIEEKVKDSGNEKNRKTTNHRIMAFAFHGSENGIDIKIIGCMDVRSAPRQPVYCKGTVLFEDKIFSVFDLQALAGLKPKTITQDSCIVLLDPNETYTDFSRAILVDDVSEMLRIAERQLEGLPIDSIFGRRWHSQPKNPKPDFPDISQDTEYEDRSEGKLFSDRKYAIGRL